MGVVLTKEIVSKFNFFERFF